MSKLFGKSKAEESKKTSNMVMNSQVSKLPDHIFGKSSLESLKEEPDRREVMLE